MMRDARTLAHLALALMLVLLSAVLGCAAGNAGSDDGLSAAPGLPVPSRNPVPIRGADVSMLDQLERQGAVFRQADGTAAELLPLLQQSGVNWVRLRLWHQPVNAADVWDGGRLVSRAGEPVGGGNNDLAATVRMARRAKALGLKLLLDFHYSDFWADPAHQAKPAAWAALQGPALHEAVREHTRNALLALRDASAFPDMVQLGNETNGGMLWPDGKTWQAQPGEAIGGAAGFAELLRTAARAVRETDPHAGQAGAVRIAVHLADGGDNALYRRVFDDLSQRQVDFDLIGLSWYPYLHGSLGSLQNNLQDLVQRYGKPVVIMETATGWTVDNADATGNVFDAEQARRGGYAVSAEGQEQLLIDLYRVLAELPPGMGQGVFWWAPEWLAVPGAGWRTGDGNGWENQALFDFNGRALPSLSAFGRLPP